MGHARGTIARDRVSRVPRGRRRVSERHQAAWEAAVAISTVRAEPLPPHELGWRVICTLPVEEALMLNKTMFALLASGTVLATPAFAAQRWGQAPVPDAGACFYQQPNYHGRYFCARAGEDMTALPSGLRDRIRAIRVFGGGQVIVYSNNRFGRRERWIKYNVPKLPHDRG